MYNYKAKYISNYDGDTVRLNIDLGFEIWLNNQSVRLYGIDCPEMRGDTKAKGQLAKDFVSMVLSSAKEINITTYKDTKEKYGRWLVDIEYSDGANWTNLNKELVNLGHATQKDY